ncbi:hypothetical protein Dimus_013540 [Dionaea muscipula]
MGGRTRGSSQIRARETVCDARSPDWKPVLFRGSPSPRPPRCRRGPPSPGTRPRRLRSPSPMVSSSTDPGAVSSSEEEDASEAAVTASEVEDTSDLEAAGMDLSLDPDLSPILEDDGLIGASGSTSSGSPVLSPTAAVLACQAAIDAVSQGSVSSFSSSPLDVVVNGECGRPTMADAVLGSVSAVPAAFGDGEKVKCGQLSQVVAGISEDVGGQRSLTSGSSHPPVESVSSIDGCLAGVEMPRPTVRSFCSSLPVRGGPSDCGLVDGGMVSEEARVSPVVREALRPQPTDGLRQPPSSPMVPVSGAVGGVGKDDSFGDGLAGEHGGGAMVAGDVLSEALYTVCPLLCLLSPVDLTQKCEGRAVDAVDVGKGFELLKKPALIGGAAVGSAVYGCAVQACSSSSTELPFLADAGDAIGQVVSAIADGGKLSEAVASIAKAGVVHSVTVFGRDGVASLIGLCGQPFSSSVMSCCPAECGSEAKESGGGLVSEEDAAPPVTRVALRP